MIMTNRSQFIYNYFTLLLIGILMMVLTQYYLPIKNKFIEKVIVFLFLFIIPYSYMAIDYISRRR